MDEARGAERILGKRHRHSSGRPKITLSDRAGISQKLMPAFGKRSDTRIMAEPVISNASAANLLDLYQLVRERRREVFSLEGKILRICTECDALMRLRVSRTGELTCPTCGASGLTGPDRALPRHRGASGLSCETTGYEGLVAGDQERRPMEDLVYRPLPMSKTSYINCTDATDPET